MAHANIYIKPDDIPLYRKIRFEAMLNGTSISQLFALWLERHEEETKEMADGDA